jgi:hypothetical protein
MSARGGRHEKDGYDHFEQLMSYLYVANPIIQPL